MIDLDQTRDYSVTRGDEFDPRVESDCRRPAVSTPGTRPHGAPSHLVGASRDRACRRAPPKRRASTAVVAARSAASRSAGRRVSQQPRITVTYQDADIRDVIAAFAAFSWSHHRRRQGDRAAPSRPKIRTSPGTSRSARSSQSQGLAAVEDADGIIAVDSYENILASRPPSRCRRRSFPINYARAGSLVATVKWLLSRGLWPQRRRRRCQQRTPGGGTASCVVRGSVAADSGTNTLIITDVPSRLGDISGYVRSLDVRTPQVAIKAKIIFVNRTNIEEIGVTYDLGSQTQFFNKLVRRTDPSTFEPVDTNGDGIPDAFGGEPFDQDTNIIDIGGNALSAIANANSRIVNPALS